MVAESQTDQGRNVQMDKVDIRPVLFGFDMYY